MGCVTASVGCRTSLVGGSEGQEFGLKSIASSHAPMPKGPEKSKKPLLPILNPSRGRRLGLKTWCWLIGRVLESMIEDEVRLVVLRDVAGRFQVQSRFRRSQ